MKKMLSRLIAGPLLVLGLCIGVSQLAAQQDPKKAAPTDPSKTDKIDTSATKAPKDDKKKDTDPLVVEAREKFGKGDFAKAAKLLEDAKAKDPLLPPWRLMLSQLYLQFANGVQNNEQRAQMIQIGRNLVEQTLTLEPNHPDAYLHNAIIALGDGRLTDAMQSCGMALRLADEGDQWSPSQRAEFTKQANIGLSTVFEQRQDWVNAKKHLSKWVGQEPDNVQARQRYARACFLTEKFDEALKELKSAAKNAKAGNEKFDPPELTMGQLYAMLIGQYPATDKPAKVKENDAKDKENTEKANKWFTDATELYKDNAQVFQAYADWLLKMGKKDEAKKMIDKALQIDKDGRDTLALVGLLARHNGEFAKAATSFQTILVENPGDFFATNQLALVLSEDTKDTKKMARAILLAEDNVRRSPRSAEAHATLAWVYFRQGRFDEAEREIAVAVSSGQGAPDTVYYLAKILADHKKSYIDAHDNLKLALKTKGPFFYRQAAEDWIDKLKAQATQEKIEKEKAEKEKKEKEKKDSPTSVKPEGGAK